MVVDMIVNTYFGLLSMIFSPILGLSPIIAETIIAGIVIFITSLFYRYMIDQEQMRKIKEEHKNLQKKAKEIQKEDPEKANNIMKEVLKLTNKQMKMTMKPMLPTMIVILAVLPWMGTVFAEPVLELSFELPLIGSSISWFVWYIIVSIPMSIGFRKALGVV